MKIYRGITNILLSKIDPLFRNPDISGLTYGSGTSYAVKKDLAESYGGTLASQIKGASWGWVLTYEFYPKKILHIDDSHYDEEIGSDAYLFIDKEMIKLSELSSFLIKNNYDAALFDAEYCCDHLFLTNVCQESQLVLEEIELYVEDTKLIEILKNKNYYYDGRCFSIPLIKEVQKDLDDILKNF